MSLQHTKVPRWKQIYHKWKSIRSIPFRKRWFVGYDLQGNAYWEFQLSRNLPIRRIIEYQNRRLRPSDYVEMDIPPRWVQWLRHTRSDVPTLQELIDEERRISKMKVLGQIADSKWKDKTG